MNGMRNWDLDDWAIFVILLWVLGIATLGIVKWWF